MDQFKKRYGEWALVAGAAEGIGACFTTSLAQRGVNVAMSDRNKDAMNQAATKVREDYGIEAREIHADLCG